MPSMGKSSNDSPNTGEMVLAELLSGHTRVSCTCKRSGGEWPGINRELPV